MDLVGLAFPATNYSIRTAVFLLLFSVNITSHQRGCLQYNTSRFEMRKQYCIPAMLRFGMSAHALFSILSHCTNLRNDPEWKTAHIGTYSES